MSRVQYAMVLIFGVLLLLTSPLLQLALVCFAKEVVTDNPELEHLFVPYSVAAVITVLCLQGALVVILLLLRRIYKGSFYEPLTLRLIDALTVSLALVGLIPVLVIQHLNWAENVNPFPLMLLCWILVFVTPSVVIVLHALRGVYMKAAADHHELKQVI